MLIDRFGRVVENLRISVTGRCNLNCIFCHSEGYNPLACNKSKNREMKLSEILEVVEVCSKYGIKKVKITGGEPLLRWDIIEVVERMKEIEGVEEVSMVSNGILLSPLAKKLAKAGLDRINVSLHTLKEETYEKIVRADGKILEKVILGIKEAKKAGIETKINVTVLRGYNEKELFDLIDFAKSVGVNIQFIEYHTPHFIRPEFKKFFFSLKNFEKELEKIAESVYKRRMHHRKRFLMGEIYVETVRPMFNPEFCENCTRIRVVGYKFKPCLMRNDNLVDFERAFLEKDKSIIEKALIEAVGKREPYFR